jgi:hypothetical protein
MRPTTPACYCAGSLHNITGNGDSVLQADFISQSTPLHKYRRSHNRGVLLNAIYADDRLFTELVGVEFATLIWPTLSF